jgi:glutamyl-tRNA synthetase
MDAKARVRFAPSPTGGLHLGGVRTVLYNYLFAKQLGGDFILRIEDTDQSRYVPGAEQYIIDCLEWCGLMPDESPQKPGAFGPYRQSERKHLYQEYAEQLVKDGYAYYAFDTPEELEQMRAQYKTNENPSPQYDHNIRLKMRNSLTLEQNEVQRLMQEGTRYVTRIKLPENEDVSFVDLIRGHVSFNTSQIDDKVLLKADGMPTYHLAVVVDDYLMKITHAFRGEEWLPSAPVHVLLWKYLGWENYMPAWAHLPLIMGPSGKLSKRDGAKYGFPVFAMNWQDPRTGELTEGFREKGFLPEAFINMLAMLGWNDGTGQEIFSLEELIEKFSLDRVHKGGAKFDYEKAKWFNHEWIKRTSDEVLAEKLFEQYRNRISKSEPELRDDDEVVPRCIRIIPLIKERCHLLTDLWDQSRFFFIRPEAYDTASVKPKWTAEKSNFFKAFIQELDALTEWHSAFIEAAFKQMAIESNIKPGELQLPLRVMLGGGKF